MLLAVGGRSGAIIPPPRSGANVQYPTNPANAVRSYTPGRSGSRRDLEGNMRVSALDGGIRGISVLGAKTE